MLFAWCHTHTHNKRVSKQERERERDTEKDRQIEGEKSRVKKRKKETERYSHTDKKKRNRRETSKPLFWGHVCAENIHKPVTHPYTILSDLHAHCDSIVTVSRQHKPTVTTSVRSVNRGGQRKGPLWREESPRPLVADTGTDPCSRPAY